MKTITLSRIITLCALVPALAAAESEQRQPRGERPSFHAMWEKYDVDGDGSLSISEFQAMPRIARLPEEQQLRLFRRLDKNDDGQLTQDELRQMRHARGGERPAHGMRRIMELDTDGSGGVSLEEFRAGELFANLPPERVEALFRRLDTDGDGEITPKDRPEMRRQPPHGPRGEHGERGERGGERGERPEAHRRLFNQLDADESGFLSFEEFRKARGIAAMDEDAQEALFLRLDRDGDHRLNAEEFSKAPLARIAPPPRRGGENRRRGIPGQGNDAPNE